MWISDNSRFCNIDYCKTIINEFYNAKNQNNGHKAQEEFERLVLFEFANRIAAVILYIMIQAMHPANKERINLKGKDKDKSARIWIDSINPDRIFQVGL